jgi:hypothetical protein
MKTIVLVIFSILLSVNCYGDQHSGNNADITAAKAAIKQLATDLQSELKAAMQAGGPVAAIGVCNTRAMPITQKVASQQGLQLGRVSLKNRNPANMPNDWQAAVLEDFERQKAEGKEVESIAWSETVSVDGEQEFRLMKAIPTGQVCLMCHGTEISPQIKQVLADLYPADRATGYSEGDIRGAFVVTRQTSSQ